MRPHAVIPQADIVCFSSNERHKITVRETILMVSLENLIFRLILETYCKTIYEKRISVRL